MEIFYVSCSFAVLVMIDVLSFLYVCSKAGANGVALIAYLADDRTFTNLYFIFQ